MKTTPLTIEAVTSRAKSANSAKSTAKHVKGLINFYIDTRSESAATLPWGVVVLIHYFIDALEERGGMRRLLPDMPSLCGPTPWELTGR